MGLPQTIEGPETGGSDNEASDASRPCVEIAFEDERWANVEGLEALIPALVADALMEAGLSEETHAVSLAFVSDAAMQTLNRTFRGKDSATNVLSFPAVRSLADEDSNETEFLGDIAIAYDTVAAEARAEHKTMLAHTAHLIVHGVLHLAGYDHDGEESAERMEASERAVLARAGIADPYADSIPPDAHSHL